ncbi:hypothetical protein [Virgisporangium aurantiacum]|uniref:hypothetical protein n=1 Tax=Virgisporangium aurantiacum TaxID=175570 RepID=UPI001EF28FC6|nr:hypothetical protein [Virgisporangium aurantiacum]
MPNLPLTDVAAAGVAVGLVAAAAGVGAALHLSGRPPGASAAPVYAHWLPHVGPGTPLAVVVAVGVVRYGPGLAARLPWSRLLPAAVAAAGAWILSLALVDGWRRGVAGRLTTRHEYLSEVDAVRPGFLRGFTDRILDFQPDSWATHVAGHPPGALLVFAGLDRIGLGGGGWAATACVLAGASVAASVPWTVRILGDDAGARAAVPFAVLLPGAVWLGVSADALFAGAAAAGVALLATGLATGPVTGPAIGAATGPTARRIAGAATGPAIGAATGPAIGAATGPAGRRIAATVAGGAVLAFCCYLSYGLVLMLPVVLALVVVTRRVRPLGWAVAGGAAVVAAFTLAGFWWLDGYHLTVRRYYQGLASARPYAYWVWANLALLVLSAGPVAAAVLRRAVPAALRDRARQTPVVLLPLAAFAAIAAADLSGLSKAEVERIWLPFAVWLPAGAALLPAPTHRWWLAAQATTALVINHLLLTTW